MSFYYDDDDASQKSTSCPNCGSTDNYHDDKTGALVCSSCFTQSQAHTQEELDLEEVQALAARNQVGRIMGIRRRRNPGGNFVKRKLEEWDTSTSFPSIETCLEGYKVVLQVATNSLCELLKLSAENTMSAHATVKRIWFSYLKTWKEAAEFYGKLHPEVRFSIRDAFINLATHRAQILRYLSYEAVKKINKEQEAEPGEKRSTSTLGTKIITGTSVSISQMLDLYKRKGRLEAALRTRPSMTQAASIILLAMSRLGIAAHHILSWIANGKLPLVNAFRSCLTRELQEKLRHISYFFRLESVPSIHQVEYQAKLLLVTSRTKGDVSQPILITPNSVPLLTTRLVMDLGFPQQVLDNALSLMGLYKGPPRYWLPSPLVRLDVNDFRHVIGVLVVAVKMCPHWHSWKYYRRSPEMPWNDAMAQQLKNGHLHAYLNFCDTMGRMDPTESCLPEFTSKLNVDEDFNQSSPIFPILLAGHPNPNQPRNMEARQKHHEFYLRIRKRNAVWADANGVGEYVLYEKDDDLSYSHPHYLALLEHIGRICYLAPMEIHTIVVGLEEEVRLLGRDVEPQPVKTAEHWKTTKTPQQLIEQLQKEAAANPYLPTGRVRNRNNEATKAKARILHPKAYLEDRKQAEEKKRMEKAEKRKKTTRAAIKKRHDAEQLTIGMIWSSH